MNYPDINDYEDLRKWVNAMLNFWQELANPFVEAGIEPPTFIQERIIKLQSGITTFKELCQ